MAIVNTNTVILNLMSDALAPMLSLFVYLIFNFLFLFHGGVA